MADRITKEEAVSFLLTYIVIERNHRLRLDPLALFELMNLALQGTQVINSTPDVTPHEVLEDLANGFIQSHPDH